MSSNLQVDSTLSTTKQYVKDASGNASVLAIGTDAKIGIGTTAPGKTLDLVYSSRKIELDVTTSSYPRMAFYGESVVINKESGYKIYFGEDADTGGYLFRGTGSVGIGTSAPIARVEIKSNGNTSASTALDIINSSGTSIMSVKDDGTTSVNGVLKGNNDCRLASGGAYYLGDNLTDGTWRMTRDSNSLKFMRRESSSWNQKMELSENCTIFLPEQATTPTFSTMDALAVYMKGDKIIFAAHTGGVGGTVKYVSIDMSTNGNAWGTVTSTAP